MEPLSSSLVGCGLLRLVSCPVVEALGSYMPVFACCCLQAGDADASSLAVPAVILLLSRAVARLCLRLLIRILTQNFIQRPLLPRRWCRP